MDKIESLSFQLASVMKKRKVAEQEEQGLRKEIESVMFANRQRTASNRFLSIKYKEESIRRSLDAKAIEIKYPEVFEDDDCWKESIIKPYIAVIVKDKTI